ncbi:MAG: hypothetical protein JW913_19400 [Chitinispirillaceae bacterium]|nr:hypothetical protein [Chitinispirillaceae bacterium]
MKPPPAATPQSSYRESLAAYSRQHIVVRYRVNLISNLRLVVVIAAAAGAIVAFRMHSVPATAGAILTGIILFILLAARHSRLFARLNELKALVAINRQGIDRCEGRWGAFQEQGGGFVDHEHPYTSDLDIFGRNSLFQYLCCAHTWYGKRRLAELLQKRCGAAADITARQESVGHLAQLFSWRQMMECCGYAPEVGRDPDDLIAWAESGEEGLFGRQWMKRAILLLPYFMGAIAAAGYFGAKNLLPAILLLGLQIVLVALSTRRNLRLFNTFDKYGKALGAYGAMIGHIEQQVFDAVSLKTLQGEVAGEGGACCASSALKRLAAIISATEARFSPLPWFFANAFLLWDFRCVIRLEDWKRRHGTLVRKWLACIGEFEALSSLALLRFDHTDWVVPAFREGGETGVAARGIGHPLLPAAQCIVNDFNLGPPGGSVGIITGSNMSGKSTFLRTVGCNLALAYAGAPVCAARLECPLLDIYTSMRTDDDLLSHTSTFYAELLRVKKIVDAAAGGAPLLFLLDELFRGTNSADRHDGAVALLAELSRPHTLGLISTHDLELCTLAAEGGSYRNYHFEEFYEGGSLRFDYLLKSGPSTTRNALYLMRMAGIGVGRGGDDAPSPEKSPGEEDRAD